MSNAEDFKPARPESDLSAFIGACAAHWKALFVGAALALGAVAGSEQLAERTFAWPVYAVAAAVVVAMQATFLAFKSERRARFAAPAEPPVTSVLDELTALVSHDPTPPVVEAPIAVTEITAPAPSSEPSVESIPAAAAPSDGPPRRTFLEFTAKDLVDLFTDESAVRLDKAADAYVGKWLEAILVVSTIRDYAPGNCVFVNGRTSDLPSDSADETSDGWTDLTCTFDRSVWLTQLQARRSGDAIQVMGEVKDIDSSGVGLIRCELRGNRRVPAES